MENIGSIEMYQTELQCCDPLEGLGDEVSLPHYYRVDCKVFAEPIKYQTSDKNCNEQKGVSSLDSTITLNENVMVTKRMGKGKTLFVHLQDQSILDCPIPNCTKSFSSPPLLKAHIRKVHYSEKRHMCELCGASFTAQYLLERHSAVHTEERVQCPVCKKMLSARTNLTQHLRSHSDTRPHECRACGKRFLRSSTLKIHTKSAHKQKL